MRTDFTREELIAICERAIVPEAKWMNRDSPNAQQEVGRAWAFLKAGCSFRVCAAVNGRPGNCETDERTIWIEIDHRTFCSFEYGGGHVETETFYLPTPGRLQDRAGRDWY